VVGKGKASPYTVRRGGFAGTSLNPAYESILHTSAICFVHHNPAWHPGEPTSQVGDVGMISLILIILEPEDTGSASPNIERGYQRP